MHKSSERSNDGCVWNEDAPTVVSCAFFSATGACGHLQPQALLCPSVPLVRKGRGIMRKFKTSKGNRTNYIYYTAEGKKVELKPGQNGVDETWITMLHDWDDEQLDADRREEYHCPVHYQAYSDGEGEDADDRNHYLCDTAADPLEQMLASINEQEHSEKLDRLKGALTTLTDLQRDTIYKKFYRNMSNVDIAAEEGVSEAAIRNRLKKIFANLAKKI